MLLPLVVVTVMVALLLLLLLHSKATHRGNTSPSEAQAATHPKKSPRAAEPSLAFQAATLK